MIEGVYEAVKPPAKPANEQAIPAKGCLPEARRLKLKPALKWCMHCLIRYGKQLIQKLL